ncbi:3-oxoacyl-[acyl-carrier protein] reductase [Pseudorhizobium tarimense]|uniref:3-oxoacyl-[acyl-carrier protein] reductase n=1 Tax=Pseudorhizobium tarimense TaxID=1079109 RepID=A0ABV2H3E2_9HYPH|nr:SDR family oxidoreductase [Pseudorhizobium tarimense]MCJ8518518.1 SDR family oxidoreductase [Pseudorhizobium tarimense]
MDLGYEGRRALIVGGSYGIGKATAALMGAEGADVLIASRSADNLGEAADDISATGATRPATLVCDVTQPDAGDTLAAAALERWGVLDLLVTAVGGSIRSSFEDLTDEDWLNNYTFNILSTVRAIRALLPALAKGENPAIVTLGAAASKMPYQHQIVSNVHKAGLLGLTKTLAAELADRGIRVNCVAPGRTLTPLWTKRADKMAGEQGRTRDDILGDFSKDIPLNRFASAEEVATMVVWLASPRASYITGQTVNVDGGIARGLL